MKSRPALKCILFLLGGAALLAGCGGTEEPMEREGPVATGVNAPRVMLSAQRVLGAFPTSSPTDVHAERLTPDLIQDSGKSEERGPEAGCTPSLQADFIDGETWNNRRLVPVDCAAVAMQAPLFSWRQPTDRDRTKAWKFTLQRGTGEIVTSIQSDHPRHQLQQLLGAGDYKWTVTYTRDRGAREQITSAARRFTVLAGASSFRLPEGAALASQVSRKVRPRILPAGSSFGGIVSKASAGEYAQRYASLLRDADKVLDSPIPSEPPIPDVPTDSRAYKEWKREIANIVRKERKNVATLGFAWRFTGKSKYRDNGVARVIALSDWSTTGGSSDASNDLVNGDVFVTLSRGMDLFDGSINDNQKKHLASVVKSRIEPAMSSFSALDADPYDSHDVELVREVVNALLSAAGSFPEAEAWLASAWDVYTTTLATWGADDGSWGNGNGYGWNMLDGFGEVIASVRLIAGVDLTQTPWVQRVGDIIMASTAPMGTHMSAFGDASEATDNYDLYAKDQFRLYAALTRSAQHAWYWRLGDSSTSENATVSPFCFMLLGLNLPEVPGAPPAKSSSVFQEAGVVAMHDDASSPNRSSVFFRSSRFGSYNHSFADQNSFTLVSQGRDVLITGGYYPYYLSKHHATVTRATRYKNALTFDGGIGQAEPVKNPSAPGKPIQSMDTRGELINYLDRGAWVTATGDATLAYRGWDASTSTWKPFLNNAIRSIAYNRSERAVLIYDWAVSESARRWELNFNALEAFAASGASAKATNKSASACIDVYGPTGSFSTTKGFAVAPEGNYPTQYQARFRAGTASNELVSVTVIRESCRTVPVNVSIQGLIASVSINGGSALRFDRRSVTVP